MSWIRGLLLLSLMFGFSSLTLAHDEEADADRPWANVTELSFVMTTGNSETMNFALSNRFSYKWEKAEFLFDVSALRTENDMRTAMNVGGSLVVTETSATTAEAYDAMGKLRYDIYEGFFVYGATGWNRNEFAGIEDRFFGGLGGGYRIFSDDVHELIGEAGVNYTDETYIPGTLPDSVDFAEGRAFLGYARKLTDTSDLTSEIEGLFNFDETDDVRLKWVTGVSAALSSKIALKIAYTVLYDGDPVVQVLSDPSMPAAGDVMFEFDETDTVLSASVVINF